MFEKNRNNIEYIKEHIKISDIVKEKVKLKQNGSIFKGLCPFHREKTPSFIVDDQRKTFHCFGCSSHGDIFTFLQKTTTLTFQEILYNLSSKLGIQNTPYKNKIDTNEEEKLRILELTTQFFAQNLANHQNAQYYLQQRMINKETIKKFRLGYASNNNDLYKFLREKCELNCALDLGLLSKKNGKIYDYFFNRLMFPIININNKVVGFGGRILDEKNNYAKYINSKESDIFEKNKLLYGENLLINKEKSIFITEGYFDVLAMYQKKISAVAVMGTTINDLNLKKIYKYNKEINFFFDSDEAGRNAINKIIFDNILPNLQYDINIYIIKLHKIFKDPYDMITKNSYKKENLYNKYTISEFIWQEFIKNNNFHTPEQCMANGLKIKKIIDLIPNYNLRKNYHIFFKNKIIKDKFKKNKKKRKERPKAVFQQEIMKKYPKLMNNNNKE